MRVLSFIPTFLLAATSFVAAVPTSPSGNTETSSIATRSDESAVQPVINIVVNASAEIKLLGNQLSSICQSDSVSNDLDTVTTIVSNIAGVVSYAVGQLESETNVDYTNLDISGLFSAINDLVAAILDVLNTLVTTLLSLAGHPTGTLKSVTSGLLNAVNNLVSDLNIPGSSVLTSLLSVVSSIVQSLLTLIQELLN